MSMKNPPHPGKVVQVSCLEPLGLNVTEGAKVLGVSRQALSNLVNCRGPHVYLHGGSARESFWLHAGDMDTLAGCLRCSAGASA